MKTPLPGELNKELIPYMEAYQSNSSDEIFRIVESCDGGNGFVVESIDEDWDYVRYKIWIDHNGVHALNVNSGDEYDLKSVEDLEYVI